MPILKVEGRLWHLAKKLNQPEAWLDNSDLRPFPEVGRKRKGGGDVPRFLDRRGYSCFRVSPLWFVYMRERGACDW